MGKKFIVMVSLFMLISFVNVEALTCEYKDGVNIKLTYDGSFWDSSVVGYESDHNISGNNCPSSIYYSCNSVKCNLASSQNFLTMLSGGRSGSALLNNQGTGGGGGPYNPGVNLPGGNVDCESIYGDLLEFLDKNVFKIIYYLTPIILIILTSVDFAKAVFSDEKDGMKKATGNFVKRAIAALLIFLAPTVVEIVLSLLNRTQC